MAKVLIVDDSPTILAIIGRFFTRAGYQVFTAADAQSGLTKARAVRPDLILLDCILPDMDGIEVCRACKSDPQTQSAKVIMLTGNFDPALADAAKQAGVDDFHTKEASGAQLLEAAARLLA